MHSIGRRKKDLGQSLEDEAWP